MDIPVLPKEVHSSFSISSQQSLLVSLDHDHVLSLLLHQVSMAHSNLNHRGFESETNKMFFILKDTDV